MRKRRQIATRTYAYDDKSYDRDRRAQCVCREVYISRVYEADGRLLGYIHTCTNCGQEDFLEIADALHATP